MMFIENDKRKWNKASGETQFPVSSFKFLQRKSSRAFSLIELLVVIAIIGILSSIVMASLSTARLRSRDSRRVSDMKQVQIALELYYDEYGQYPICVGQTSAVNCFPVAMEVLKGSGYLPSIPVDPLSTTADKYLYAPLSGGSTTKCKSYHLGATLEDENNSALNDAAREAGQTMCSLTPNVPDFNATVSKITCNKTGTGTFKPRCYDLKP